MVECLAKQAGNVLIIQSVVRQSPVAAGTHKATLAQDAQLMGRGGLAQPEGCGCLLYTYDAADE